MKLERRTRPRARVLNRWLVLVFRPGGILPIAMQAALPLLFLFAFAAARPLDIPFWRALDVRMDSSDARTPTGAGPATPTTVAESIQGDQQVYLVPPAFSAMVAGAPHASVAQQASPATDGNGTVSSMTTGNSTAPILAMYYPDWLSKAFPPERLDFSRIDYIDFAFAVPQEDFTLGWDGAEDAPDVLGRLVTMAHSQGKKVKVSVGGWTGSKCVS